MSKTLNIISWPVRKIFNSTKAINTVLESPLTIKKSAEHTFVYTTKVTGATTGTAGIAKGSIDALEALACQDGVCFAVSCIGVAADSLQVLASFVPGANNTMIVTMPVSYGCKVFVWCCKRSSIPWFGNCKN